MGAKASLFVFLFTNLSLGFLSNLFEPDLVYDRKGIEAVEGVELLYTSSVTNASDLTNRHYPKYSIETGRKGD